MVRYVEDAFIDSYYPTIENVFEKTIKYKGQEYYCDIVDTAGQDEYSILNYTGTATIPCVIVGQKSDLHVQRYVARMPRSH